MRFLYPQLSKRSRIVFGLLLVLSVTTLTFYYGESSNGILHRAQRYTVNMVVPLQSGFSRIVTPLRSAVQFVSSIGGLSSKNRRLTRENQRLKAEIAQLEQMKKENKRLRKLVGFKQETDFVTVPAHIIGKSSTDWQAVIILDKGRDDGVMKNMPVVVDGGLVGQVIDSSPKACRVQLITDQKSGVGVQIVETGDTGVLQGQIDGELRLSFISKEVKLTEGDRIVTSGLGGVFPKGIYVGTVQKVGKRAYSLFKEIKVKSAVEFSKLEDVLIITKPLPHDPLRMDGE